MSFWMQKTIDDTKPLVNDSRKPGKRIRKSTSSKQKSKGRFVRIHVVLVMHVIGLKSILSDLYDL